MIDIAKASLRIGVDKNYTEFRFRRNENGPPGLEFNASHFERVLDMCKPRTIIEVGTWEGSIDRPYVKLADNLL